MMRAGGIAMLGILALVLGSAGPAAAANPITVVLTGQNAATTSAQACVSAVITDSVTNQPLAADIELQINGGPTGSEDLQLKTDPTGKGTLCFNEPGISRVSVTLYLGGGIVVHANPDYATTGTSNTVTVSWGLSTPVMAITPASTSSSLVVGQVDTVDVKLAYGTQTTLAAISPTLEIDLSGASASVVSATADSGSCSGSTTVSCSFSDIVPGAQANVELRLDPSAAGTLTLAFTARWHTSPIAANTGQPVTQPASATGSLSLPVAVPSADLSVTLAASRTKPEVGKTADVSVVVRDAGPQGATGATLAFTVPAGVRIVRVQGSGIDCVSSGRSCTIASIGPSGKAKYVLALMAARSGMRQLSAKVAVGGGAVDPVAANDSARLTLDVLAAKSGKK